MKLITTVDTGKLPVNISLSDKIMVLGSCFADGIGARLKDCGFDICLNPFGTLYNPASIARAMERLESGRPFSREDCVQMGAGAGLVCSFSHHTSFARLTEDEFLGNTNLKLAEASVFWHACSKVIITLGTAMVWKHGNAVVSNCLKRPASEFSHEMLGIEECGCLVQEIKDRCSDRDVIFTVSPIRHLSQGAHNNTLSKSTLLLSLEKAVNLPHTAYFPAFEIMNDELRDYRFYAEDLCHPSKTAVEYIWERFTEAAVPGSEHSRMVENEKAARRLAHRSIHQI